MKVAGLLEVTATTWTQLETTSQRYEALIPDSALNDLQQKVKDLGEARLKFIRIKHLAEAFVKAKTPTVATNTSTGRRADIQIPELKVITFSGKPIDWPNIWNSFEVIHNHGDLMEDVKLRHIGNYVD